MGTYFKIKLRHIFLLLAISYLQSFAVLCETDCFRGWKSSVGLNCRFTTILESFFALLQKPQDNWKSWDPVSTVSWGANYHCIGYCKRFKVTSLFTDGWLEVQHLLPDSLYDIKGAVNQLEFIIVVINLTVRCHDRLLGLIWNAHSISFRFTQRLWSTLPTHSMLSLYSQAHFICDYCSHQGHLVCYCHEAASCLSISLWWQNGMTEEIYHNLKILVLKIKTFFIVVHKKLSVFYGIKTLMHFTAYTALAKRKEFTLQFVPAFLKQGEEILTIYKQLKCLIFICFSFLSW